MQTYKSQASYEAFSAFLLQDMRASLLLPRSPFDFHILFLIPSYFCHHLLSFCREIIAHESVPDRRAGIIEIEEGANGFLASG